MAGGLRAVTLRRQSEQPDAPTNHATVQTENGTIHVDAYGPIAESTLRALELFAKWCQPLPEEQA